MYLNYKKSNCNLLPYFSITTGWIFLSYDNIFLTELYNSCKIGACSQAFFFEYAIHVIGISIKTLEREIL